MKEIIRTQEQLDNFISRVLEAQPKLIWCDIETEEFSSTKWVSYQLGLEGIGIYASDDLQAYIIYKEGIDYSWLDVLLHSIPNVWHNAKFDLAVLEKAGILTMLDLIPLHDSMLLSFVEDEDKIQHGLKPLSKKYLWRDDVIKYEDVWPKPQPEVNLFSIADPDAYKASYQEVLCEWEQKMWFYCLDDCKNTLELFYFFKNSVEKQDGGENGMLWRVYEKLEVPFLLVLLDMETRGVKLDEGYLKKLEADTEDKLLELETSIYTEAWRKFDIGSPKQIREIFDEKWIVVPENMKTATGLVATDNDALVYLEKNGVTLWKLLLEWRELSKLQSTYITGIPKLAIDGVIHTSFKQTGTKTGRLSSTSPNLQNIPRRADHLNIRAAFKPRPWYKFVICDLSQAELRMMAHFSQEPTLIEAYKNNKDVHQATADLVGCSRTDAKCFTGDTVVTVWDRIDTTERKDSPFRTYEIQNCRDVKLEDIIPKVNRGKSTILDNGLVIKTEEGYEDVVYTYYWEDTEFIEFELRNWDSIKVTPDHRCVVWRDNKEIEVLAKDVLDTDYFIYE